MVLRKTRTDHSLKGDPGFNPFGFGSGPVPIQLREDDGDR